MNRIKLLVSVLFCLLGAGKLHSQEGEPVDFVDPFIGTDFHGHTYPGTIVPFGMVQLSPDTRLKGWDGCSGYHFTDDTLYGFSHTHLSGTGVADYCDILLMPVAEKVFNRDEYASPFKKESEHAGAGYYTVYLQKPKVKAELTASARVGFHRYTFRRAGRAGLLIDLSHRDRTVDSWLRVVSPTEIHGYRRSSSWASDQQLYFVIRFSQPVISGPDLVDNDSLILQSMDDGTLLARGKSLKAWMKFPKLPNGVLLVKVGLSAVSEEGAVKNLETELPGWNFDAVVKMAQNAWQSELGKIMIEGGTIQQRRIFYTSLYHAMVVPNLFSDVDGYYRTMGGTVEKAKGFTPYTVFSLWDTYRAWHPLMTIIDTKRTTDYINTFLSHYRTGGRLPVWELAGNETDCMIGYHSVSVITDAWIKGIRGFDSRLALRAMKHSANLNHFGLRFYRRYGFIPGDMEPESVSKTLEYAYDDWCIARFALSLGDSATYRIFSKRAQYYRNLFDPETRFMRPRINGGWKRDFNPAEVDQNFTEANSWQYSFYVPHDLSNLIAMHGGSEAFDMKLDELFTAKEELTGKHQADITGLIGQYAHGNEPSHHMAYLYAFAGKPWKTQRMVRQILREHYSDKPDGLCGNEDCGQMSAWYIFSAMGFYPVCPGTPQYIIGSPIFPKVTINLENGKHFTIIAENVSEQNFYIDSVLLNGKTLNRSWITHEEIMAGGELHLFMSDKPNRKWASAGMSVPRTGINAHPIALAPTINARSRTFTDTLTLHISSPQPDAMLFYSVEDPEQVGGGTRWKQGKSVTISNSKRIRAYAILPDGTHSAIVQATFIRVADVKRVTYTYPYSNLYSGGGNLALFDGHTGGSDFRLGGWQGFQDTDFEIVVDFGKQRHFSYLGARFLQDVRPWIMMPRLFSVSASSDGVTFTRLADIVPSVPDTDMGPLVRELGKELDVDARYIKLYAKAYGPLPDWHISAGKASWLFVDEVIVR